MSATKLYNLPLTCLKDWPCYIDRIYPSAKIQAYINTASKVDFSIYITKLLERSSHTVRSHKIISRLRISVSKTYIVMALTQMFKHLLHSADFMYFLDTEAF